MKRTFLLFALLLSFSAFAQQTEMPKPQLYIVHEEVVKPSAMMQYEASAKDFVAALSEKKFSSPALNWRTFMTPDFHYIYLAPIANFAAYDSVQGEWGRARDTVGASRWDDVGACSEIASDEPISFPARSITGTTPAVDSVMRRLEMAMPSPSAATRSASRTASKL